MKVACYSTKPYDEDFLSAANEGRHEFLFLKPRLDAVTAALASGCEAVCVFVNDVVDRPTLEELSRGGVKKIVLRCAGFNNVDLEGAKELGFMAARVPEYSPYSVAEHAIAMMLCLNRKIHRAYNRIREGNFELNGLMGFDMRGKTAAVIGTGRIGAQAAILLQGFGCRVLAYDLFPSDDLKARGVEYVGLEEAMGNSEIVTLHCPLTPETKHIINEDTLSRMRDGVMLINTSRGSLLNTRDVLKALKSGKIGYLGLDVYEDEADLFFEDRSGSVMQDDTFARLLTFNNVLITGHQAFFTGEALRNIAAVTIGNLTALGEGKPVEDRNRVV